MKRAITLVTASVLFAAVLTFGSCKKDDSGKSCNELATEASAAAMNYASNPQSVEYCNAYKNAITAYIDGCDVIDPALKDQYLMALEGLDCGGGS